MDPTPFLHQLAGRVFRWGETDCALVLADYWLWAGRRNRDPAEDLRGTYETEQQCIAVLRERGGLLRVVREITTEINAERVPDPVKAPVGSFGVVRFGAEMGRESHYGAIKARSGRWAIKCNDGLMFAASAKPVAIWTP